MTMEIKTLDQRINCLRRGMVTNSDKLVDVSKEIANSQRKPNGTRGAKAMTGPPDYAAPNELR